MKRRPHALPLLATIVTLATGAMASEVANLLAEAQRAYTHGNLAEAREKFGMVQKVDPGNRTAYIFLHRIAADEAAQKTARPPANVSRAALERMILEKVDFRDATLADVLEFLRQKGNELGGGRMTLNFVQPADEAARNAKITLTLQKVPFTEALRYVGEMADVKFVYEPYAIVVKSKGVTAAGQ